MVTEEYVRKVFAPFEKDDHDGFFVHIIDNVHVTILGSHNPFAGEYHSMHETVEKSVGRLTPYMATPLERKVKNILVAGDWAVVEHTARANMKSGSEYDQEFCWLCRFEGGKIVEMKMYMDSALVRDMLSEHGEH
jgi:uncharacterized protein